MTTALLVDDEPNLLAHLERLLKKAWPELAIVAKAYNGREALALAADELPDIVFLDIRMPGLSGLDVAEQLPADTQVVFTTAYDEYAVQAFERAAADYLLKPLSQDRLELTRDRLQQRLGTSSLGPDGDSGPGTDSAALSKLVAELRGAQTNYLQWLKTGTDGSTELVSIDDVVYFQAQHKYTSLFTQQAEHLVRITIKELEEQLDPERFWRIHRGTIVSVHDIVRAKRDLKGRYSLTLKRRPETLRSSATYSHRFKQM